MKSVKLSDELSPWDIGSALKTPLLILSGLAIVFGLIISSGTKAQAASTDSKTTVDAKGVSDYVVITYVPSYESLNGDDRDLGFEGWLKGVLNKNPSYKIVTITPITKYHGNTVSIVVVLQPTTFNSNWASDK